MLSQYLYYRPMSTSLKRNVVYAIKFKHVVYVKFSSRCVNCLYEVAFCYINHYLDRYPPYFYPHSQAALRILVSKMQVFTWFTSQTEVWPLGYVKKQMHTAVKEPLGNPSPLGRRVHIHRWNLYGLLLAMQKYFLFCHNLEVQE